MTGAYTTPLDLTDFSVSARTQLGFKLTRMVARFDVENDASVSQDLLSNRSAWVTDVLEPLTFR